MTFTIRIDRLALRLKERLEREARLRGQGLLVFQTKAQRKAAKAVRRAEPGER